MEPQLIYIAAAVVLTAGMMWLALGRRTKDGSSDPRDGPSMANVKRYLREGKKILAIKEYRDLTGAELADAKAFVDSLEGPARPVVVESGNAIDDALRGGHKIEAIKLHREQFGTGLKEAKDAVEARERELGLSS